MTIGIAIVIVAVMYFIDKHNRWMQILKLVVGLAVAAGLIYGSIYAYDKYATWRIANCIAKSTPAGNETAAAEIEAACDRDPSKPLVLNASASTPLRQTLECSKNGKLQTDLFTQFGGVLVQCPPDESPVYCGQDKNGHIVLDGKGGCIPPPPDGYIIDAPTTK
jgi:hypothetical protein